ncbi:LysR family transcriptional regulator [Micromonospora sp. STR1_7]|uniref:LysR family transcriptional regulator n=1 Tax=Micromonospora parastrephiae TaxID=2806101 RepID=A0ABS1XWI4_9ACTN|nr:LysR family transcriptional regulator [Micromonospora parastrephiae]MBM0233627.1 LysR family transcriptional regulator [Micromonospora parastrephiae]
MDVVAACRAFVAVSGHGSFTAGAVAAGIPQSVASRRVAALEEHFGAQLFDRSSRAVRLTPFGRDMLPTARRLIDLADALAHDAERARRSPFRLAVPDTCAARHLAAVVAEGHRRQIHLEVLPAGPEERARLCRTLEVRAGIVPVPPGDAAWRVPLGLAGRVPFPAPTLFLETLRPGRTTRTRRRILIQPEDDVPHVRDPLTRLGQSVGLQPAQVVTTRSLIDAAAEALSSPDLLLCSLRQAEEFGLHWGPLAGEPLARGYDLSAGARDDAHRLRAILGPAIARCLGVPSNGRTSDEDPTTGTEQQEGAS